MESPSKAVLGTAAVAEMFGMTPNAVYVAVRRGRLPARKLGRRLVFLRAELEAYLRALPPRPVA